MKEHNEKEWLFQDPPNVMVITTKRILNRKEDITLVSHDIDDGMWQFLDGFELDEKNAAIVSLQEIVKLDTTILYLHNLPLGWIALRKKKTNEWIFEKNN